MARHHSSVQIILLPGTARFGVLSDGTFVAARRDLNPFNRELSDPRNVPVTWRPAEEPDDPLMQLGLDRVRQTFALGRRRRRPTPSRRRT